MKRSKTAPRAVCLAAIVAGANVSSALAATGDIYNLQTLGGSESEAKAINDAGEIAGSSKTPGDAAWAPFRYTGGLPGAGGSMQGLGNFGGYSFGYAINDI